MQVIINDKKYDTSTAILLISHNLDDISILNLYQNSRKAFFSHICTYENNEIIEEKIIPFTKEDAMTMLIKNNAIDKYEALFGEIPEAEGEDYNPDEKQLILEKKTIEKENQKFIPGIFLVFACLKNDFEKAAMLVFKGANVNALNSICIKKAILNENIPLINLLLENQSIVSEYNYVQAILLGNLEILKLLLSKKQEEISFENLIKISKKYKKTDVYNHLINLTKES